MSAWIVGLALAAGYLINKNIQIKGTLQNAEAKFNSAANPSTNGTTSSEVRKAWTNVDNYSDMNSDLTLSAKQALHEKAEQQRNLVESYEAGPSSIEGVLMTFDRVDH